MLALLACWRCWHAAAAGALGLGCGTACPTSELLCPPSSLLMLLAPAHAHRSCLQPVLSFDLGAPVGDVAWAPFSSTVFAAVTDGGRAHVFDLAQNRDAAVCVQRAARKARCTKLAFNARHPVLLVGDEQGGVTCLKLSPNLRRSFNQGERLHACMGHCQCGAALTCIQWPAHVMLS
jgi:hypothetical protein